MKPTTPGYYTNLMTSLAPWTYPQPDQVVLIIDPSLETTSSSDPYTLNFDSFDWKTAYDFYNH